MRQQEKVRILEGDVHLLFLCDLFIFRALLHGSLGGIGDGI